MSKQTMGKRVDFEQIRKKRQRSVTIKRLLRVTVLVVILGGLVLLNRFMVEESITTRISDVMGDFGGSGYPVPLPGGIIRAVGNTGDHLVVLNDTNLYVYNTKGKVINSVQEMSDNTVLLAGDNRLLTYDTGGKHYTTHTRSKSLPARELEYGILTAGMNARGDTALVSSSKQYACELRVYNRKNGEIFRKFFSDNLVSTVSIAPRGDRMAAGYINTQEGVLVSGVEIYLFSSDQTAVEMPLPGCLVLEVQYLEDDRIGVLTDQQYIVINAMGSILYSYDLKGREIAHVETSGRKTLLLLENKDARTRDVVLLDDKCNEKATLTFREKVLDIALSSKRVYLLTEDQIQVLNHQLEVRDTYQAQFVSRIHLIGSKLYYLTRDEIKVLGQAEEKTTSQPDQDEDDQGETQPLLQQREQAPLPPEVAE